MSMFIHDLEYHCPQNMEELLSLLKEYGDNAKVLAGGTDLILQMKLHRWKQEHLIDIKRVDGLRKMGYEGGHFVIGSNTTLTELLDSPDIRRDYNALWHAIHELADIQIRNRGTLIGNICNASPAADSSPPLLSYGSRVLIASLDGEREIPLIEFFTGPGKTSLKPGEMVKEIRIPRPNINTYCAFQKLGRVYDDIATINAAIQLLLNDSFECVSASIFMGAVGPTPLRAEKAESLLVGKKLDEWLIKEVANQAAEEARPITDVRASAAYRKRTMGVLVERALSDVYERVQRN